MALTSAPASPQRIELPPDVKLMNTSARALALLGVIALCGVAMVWFVRQPMFAIRAISIDGDVSRNSVPTIRANAAPNLAGNFLTINLASARRAFESVPWVRKAVVSRVWPNRLAVHLEEHRPVALWASDSANEKLVNDHGEVFEANTGDVDDDQLPTLEGPDDSSADVLAMWKQLGPVFAPLNTRVAALTLSARGSWQAQLSNGAVIELGRGSTEDVLARTRVFVASVPDVTAQYHRTLAHADLRHNQGYAVRLRGITTTTASASDKPARK